MQNEENKLRAELIEFIRTNDPNYARINLDEYSITALTIIKTEIEIKVNAEKKA